MKDTEYTMEDIVNMINHSEGEFVIQVEFGEVNTDEKRGESIQT